MLGETATSLINKLNLESYTRRFEMLAALHGDNAVVQVINRAQKLARKTADKKISPDVIKEAHTQIFKELEVTLRDMYDKATDFEFTHQANAFTDAYNSDTLIMPLMKNLTGIYTNLFPKLPLLGEGAKEFLPLTKDVTDNARHFSASVVAAIIDPEDSYIWRGRNPKIANLAGQAHLNEAFDKLAYAYDKKFDTQTPNSKLKEAVAQIKGLAIDMATSEQKTEAAEKQRWEDAAPGQGSYDDDFSQLPSEETAKPTLKQRLVTRIARVIHRPEDPNQRQ